MVDYFLDIVEGSKLIVRNFVGLSGRSLELLGLN